MTYFLNYLLQFAKLVFLRNCSFLFLVFDNVSLYSLRGTLEVIIEQEAGATQQEGMQRASIHGKNRPEGCHVNKTLCEFGRLVRVPEYFGKHNLLETIAVTKTCTDRLFFARVLGAWSVVEVTSSVP